MVMLLYSSALSKQRTLHSFVFFRHFLLFVIVFTFLLFFLSADSLILVSILHTFLGWPIHPYCLLLTTVFKRQLFYSVFKALHFQLLSLYSQCTFAISLKHLLTNVFSSFFCIVVFILQLYESYSNADNNIDNIKLNHTASLLTNIPFVYKFFLLHMSLSLLFFFSFHNIKGREILTNVISINLCIISKVDD